MGDGLSIILLSLLPAVFYMLVIYFTVPYKAINLKTAGFYLIIGFMSVGFLRHFWVLFPDWKHIAEYFTGGNPKLKPIKYYHYYYFVQVGFIEEFSKLMIFLLIEKFRRNNYSPDDHPMATMFYVGMVSLGFAVIENIGYGQRAIDPEGVLFWRSFTSVIGHMVFGLFMGYWIALGRIGNKLGARSLFGMFMNKYKKVRTVVFAVIGIFCASVVHGMYDLHLQLSGNSGMVPLYMLLIGSLIACYWCFTNLVKEQTKKLTKKPTKKITK